MERKPRLPIGIENFEKIRSGGYYLVDKTKLIEQLLTEGGMVSLFTRPRRFGKTLNMSMLRSFFEIGTDPALFDDLYISGNEDVCRDYLGHFPIIFLTLKDAEGSSFAEARYQIMELICEEARRHAELRDSERLDAEDRSAYALLTRKAEGRYALDDAALRSSLKLLSALLQKHYQREVIILIDEYDVPLDKAFQNGFYPEMVSLLRSMFGKALKGNDSLQLAVLTGCLRISKESIFTGLNNFTVFSITDPRFDEQFGFTEEEVRALLACYHLEEHLPDIKKWYDGYRFGNADVYCPWDVINYAALLRDTPRSAPQSYWVNTSGNELVKRFIDKADKTTQREIEQLIAGESIEKHIHPELTYDEIDRTIENLWSVLFTTGYLTQDGKAQTGEYRLRIPNEEVREIFRQKIREWFRTMVAGDTEGLRTFWQALSEGNAESAEAYLTEMLRKSISVFDPKGDRKEKEKYYHAFLTGLLIGNSSWAVLSNREAGHGFADILIELGDSNAGIVIELKSVRESAALGAACEQAVRQIKDRRYAAYFLDEGRTDIRLYGISFYKKSCKVVTEKVEGS